MVGSSSASRCLSDMDGLPVLALCSTICFQQVGLNEILLTKARLSEGTANTKGDAQTLADVRTQQTTLHNAELKCGICLDSIIPSCALLRHKHHAPFLSWRFATLHAEVFTF